MHLRSQPVSLPDQTATTVLGPRRRSTLPRFSLLCWVVAMIIFAPSAAWAAETAEAPTKRSLPVQSIPEPLIAAYLLNFVKYIEWPAAIPPPGEPWRIGVLNNKRVREAFIPLIKGMLIRGRPIEVVHDDDATALIGCQIVLLPPVGASAAAKIFAAHPVLTVFYHEKGATEETAIIELLRQEKNIRYRLNPGLLLAQGLKPTPGLLENSLPLTTPKPVRSL